jgi:DNA primase large subunit
MVEYCDVVSTWKESYGAEFVTVHIIDSKAATSVRKTINFKRCADEPLKMKCVTEKLVLGRFTGVFLDPLTKNNHKIEDDIILSFDEYYFVLDEELVEKLCKIDIKKRMVAQRDIDRERIPGINDDFKSQRKALLESSQSGE